MAGRLGELLVRENLISLQQLQKAQEEQKKAGGRIGYHLTKLGFIEESELTNFLSKQYGVPSINLKEFDIDAEVVRLVPKDVAEKHQCIPVNRAGASLILAMSDPSNIYAIDDIKFLTGYNIEVVVASEQAIKEALEKYYTEKGPSYEEVMEGFDENEISVERDDDGSLDINDLEKSAADAPVVKLVNLILLDAIKKGASDIHVEPYEKDFRVRYRVDGVLYEVMKPPFKLKAAMTSRLKIMAELDIAERRLPQDGRIKLKLGKGREMDFRVSCCPTLFGEKVVMRLLDKSNLQLDMTKLGFDVEPLRMFKEAIDRPYGMVLVTGPTGSGKTTTLYAALSEIQTSEDKIITIEDPVEYQLRGITQIPVNEKKGLTFARGLRAILRHDPDKIMVGEIRDEETAAIAVQSALTGHLVFTTVHANNVVDVLGRFLNMKVDLYNFVSALNCVLAQRLVRRICQECKHEVKYNDAFLVESGLDPAKYRDTTFFEGAGCLECNGTGFHGRAAISELLDLSDRIRGMILDRRPASEIKKAAKDEGMLFLRESALQKVMEGRTTLREINKVTFVE